MFASLPPIPDFPGMEKETIKYWKDIDVVELLKKLRKDSPEKVYYDGPITANNMPHYGHAIQWTLKDLIPRYWSMKGNFVSRNMGWDCQGIPVEYEVEKKLGFSEKKDIEKYGVEKFNQLCRESVMKYRDTIFEYETRVGRWFDETDMYYTMDASFIESMWWSLKELYKKGLLYEGHKVVAYSTRAGCSLSTHEVTDGGYKEFEDPSVTVKFKLKDAADTYLLAWTTTPWTLPGNLMLAVGKDVKYVTVSHDGEKYILAKERVEEVFKGLDYKILDSKKVEDLVDCEYIPVFDYFEEKRSEDCFKVLLADHVSDEDGTGIVHLAPYGAEDFEIFMSLGISLFDYLDDSAHFTKDIPEYEGLFYKKANPKILKDLEAKGLLFKEEKIVHKMPVCWRTGTPLIYKPVKSWYIAVTKIKERLLAENETVNWVPKHVGTRLAKIWLENARDWALSRTRYWGTPLPVWVNDKTGEKVVIGSFEELRELSGVELKDPHKPFADEITWEDKKNGGTFKRLPDVIDVWYDSGSMPFAQQHYPFENKELFEKRFPAEYACEMYEQARLWFYTMLVINVALFDKVPYKNIVGHGVMLAKDGKKLSKSKRNFPPMDEVLDTFGGDILRFFILTSPLVVAEGARFYSEALADIKKEFFLLLWNSLRYFVTYADAHEFKPILDRPKSKNELDKWILARLDQLIENVTDHLDNYLIMNATREFLPFVTDLSTWYIRRSRDRLSSGDKEALSTLYYVLCQLTKLLAPMLPFLSERMYEILGLRELTGLASVHLDLYPEAKKLTSANKKLVDDMAITRDIVSALLSQRETLGIRIKQPLSKAVFSKEIPYPELIKDEVNVLEVEYGDVSKDGLEVAGVLAFLDPKLTEELLVMGTLRTLISKVQRLRKKKELSLDDTIEVTYKDTPENKRAVEQFADEIKEKVVAISLTAGSEYDIKKV